MKKLLLFLSILFAGFAPINAQTIMNIYQNNGTVLQIPTSSIDSITYTVINPNNLATLTTSPMSNASSSSATSGGSISDSGGSLVTQRGVCWSTSQNPTTANSSTNDGIGTGSFTSELLDLTANTTYYVRAYAINNAGTAYGNQQNFTTTNGSGIVSNPGAGVSYNGYTYSSVVLGNGQEWMAENLQTANYRNGDPITNELNDIAWSQTTTGAYAFYNNDVAYNAIYGKLYNWFAVTDPRHVCPIGWHEPTDSEWTILTDYLGGALVAGGKMKTTGLEYWLSPNQDATNESGFSGLPSGYRDSDGMFGGSIGFGCYLWSSSEIDTYNAWFRVLFYDVGNAYSDYIDGVYFKKFGHSVRCLKD